MFHQLHIKMLHHQNFKIINSVSGNNKTGIFYDIYYISMT
jgi:hypothetical protein